jgi:hypothetical protein
MSDFKREPLNKALRYYISRRDKSKCFHCGKDVVASGHIDHIFPVSSGGKNYRCNLVLSCKRCNLSKSDKIISIDENLAMYHELARRELFDTREEEHSVVVKYGIDGVKDAILEFDFSVWMNAIEVACDLSGIPSERCAMVYGISLALDRGMKL